MHISLGCKYCVQPLISRTDGQACLLLGTWIMTLCLLCWEGILRGLDYPESCRWAINATICILLRGSRGRFHTHTHTHKHTHTHTEGRWTDVRISDKAAISQSTGSWRKLGWILPQSLKQGWSCWHTIWFQFSETAWVWKWGHPILTVTVWSGEKYLIFQCFSRSYQ